MENNFMEELRKSNMPIIREAWKTELKKVFGYDIEISFKDSKEIQLGLGTDVIIKTKEGRRFSIEIKTRRNKYYQNHQWLLELKNHCYIDKERKQFINSYEGWLYTTTAEYIFFGTLNETEDKIIEICGHSLAPFKYKEFKNEISKLHTAIVGPTKLPNGPFQYTVIALTPLEFLQNNALSFWYYKLGGNLNDY